MPTDHTKFSSLVTALYDAGTGQASWQRVIETAGQCFDAPSGLLQFRTPATAGVNVLGFTENLTRDLVREYSEHFYKQDPWARASVVAPGTAMIGGEVMPESELYNSEFYWDWLRPCGTFDIVGGTYPVPSGGIALVGIHRGHEAPRFGKADKIWMEIFIQHFARAIDIQSRLAAAGRQSATMLEAFDAMDAGVLLLSEDAQVLHANRTGERYLRDGSGIGVRHGRLYVKDSAGDDDLRTALRSASILARGALGDVGKPIAVPGAAGEQVLLLVCPLTREPIMIGTKQPTAIVFIGGKDPRKAIPAQLLSKIYGLTPAEARLTIALLAGESPSEYAAHYHVTANTVKSQLKGIFTKTGHSRQIDLIRELGANPILRMIRTPSE